MDPRGAGSDTDSAGHAALLADLRGWQRRLFLVGNFGSANLGDELLLSIIAGWAREANAAIAAMSTHPAWTSSLHGVRALPYNSLHATVDEVATADLVVLAGGGLFQDYDPLAREPLERFPAYGANIFAQMAHIAGALGVPLLGLAQGVGPLRGDDSRGVVREVFAKAAAITVRDRASADLLRSIGVERPAIVAPDPAWAWSPPQRAVPRLAELDPRFAGKRVLALALRDWRFVEGWEPEVAQVLQAHLPSDWACLWIDFQRALPVDGGGAVTGGVSERLMARMPEARTQLQWQGNDVSEAYGLMAQCDAALTMRLHATILAHKLGLPTTALEYDDKVSALGRALGVPAVQRLLVQDVARALPAAIDAICGPGRERAFVLDRGVAARLGQAALEHRRVLHETMGRAIPRRTTPSIDPRWLSQWHSHGEPGAPAVIHALEGRLQRELGERRIVEDALLVTQLDVSRLQSVVAAEAQARGETAAEATRYRTLYEAALSSRSYRAMKPARALAAWLRRASGKPPGGTPASLAPAPTVDDKIAADGAATIPPAPAGVPRIEAGIGRRVDIVNFTVFDWNGDRAFNGGAERYVHDLALLCRDQGLEPRLLQNARKPFERDLGGVPVVGIPLAADADLERISAGYASVIAGAALVVCSPLELAVRLPPSPRIIGINHGIGWDLPSSRPAEESLVMRRLALEALKVVGRCVCVDTNFINWVRSHDWNAARHLDYVPNYVDLARFRPHAKDFDAERLLVLYPRRLYRPRGFTDTLAACETLMARGVPIDLHLCGGADPGEEVLAAAFARRWPGRVRRSDLAMDEMPRAYEDSHIALIPTNYSEGTSLSCIEALATSNGVVASNVGGLPNLVIDGYNGLLISPGAPAITAAVARLAGDRALLARVAARGVEVAQVFSRDAWRARWVEVLQRALAAC